MTALLDYFRPDPHTTPIACPDEREKSYRHWRMRILYASFIGYAIYYFTRGTLAIAMPELKKLGYDEVQLGWMITLFQISYGTSKFANGILADRANPRYFMALGLMATGVMTIFFGLATSITAFAALWALHGWFQGCGSAPCHRLLTHWYSQNERGRWWSVWNTSHNAGAALLPPLGAILLVTWGWQSVMIVPGLIAIVTGFYLINRLRDTPQSLGLPSVEEYRNDYPANADRSAKEEELPYREILWTYVLSNRGMWVLAVAYFMCYVVRWTISNWAFHFLVDGRGYEPWMAAKCVFWYEAGGFIGGIAAGWLSDLAFRGNRPIVNGLFFAGLIPAIYAFSLLPPNESAAFLTQCLMGIMGFFIFGPQMLLAVHATEITHKKASATAIGFLGIIAYLGSAMTGGPLGYLVREGGWQNVFVMMQACALVGAVSVLPLLRWKAPHAESSPA